MNSMSHETSHLLEKILYLEAVNRKLNSALERVASLCDFQMRNNVVDDPRVALLETAAERVGQLINFKVSSFYLVDEESADFTLAYSTCMIQSVLLNDEMDHLINEKFFNWALKRKKPIIVKAKKTGETLLLHSLVTATRVRGFFIAYLAEKAHQIADYNLDLLSLVLFNCANAIESYNLYLWNTGITNELEEQLIKLSDAQNELNRYRKGLELIVEERTLSLDETNIRLERVIAERLKVQSELSQTHMELEERVLARTKDLEQIQGQVIIHEKLTAIGQLSAGIAHEFNNPINFIRTNLACLNGYFSDLLDLLQLYVRLEHHCIDNNMFNYLTDPIKQKRIAIHDQLIINEVPNIFKESEIGFKRIEEIIKVMRNFFKKDNQDIPIYFDLNQIINEASTFSLTLFQSTIRFTKELGTIPVTLGFPELIKDVLLNIILNSIQAFESQTRKEYGMVTIKTWHDQSAIWCTVSDDGPGISVEDRSRVFDPFFTTKEPGQGKGLGLSTAYDVITNKHQGKLIIDCPEGGGTVFTISLPLADCTEEGNDARVP
jgi:C4-dicarboxylate-specific signal transduction histidine kinase